jgi:hypothetical protein
MKECLNCQKEYEAKRETSKFCSVSCRVLYNRKNPKKKKVNPLEQMASFHQEMLETMFKIKELILTPEIKRPAPLTPEQSLLLHNTENKDQLTTSATYDYDGLKGLITRATSSDDLQRVWRLIRAATWLAGWQNRELDKLIQIQRTKIDF